MGERVRVVVVDDQYLARGFFEGLVRMSERYELAASLSGAEQAVAFCDEHPADLVLILTYFLPESLFPDTGDEGE